jgi:recombination protein RecA
MNLEEILSALDPKTRARIHAASDITIEKQKVPSIGMNAALAGGLAYGHQTLVYGTKSSGKSSFCLQIVAAAQKEGKVCAWIDAESSYDQEWAARLGVDSSQLIHSSASSVNDMVNDAIKLMNAGVDILVVDSISTLLAAVYFEKDKDDLKQLEDTKQIGAEARDMANAVKMLRHSNEKTLLILISQMRSSFMQNYVKQIPTGGQAVQYESGTIIKLTAKEAKADAISGDFIVGDKIISETVARPVDWLIEKNKFAAPSRSGSFDFYFAGKSVGIDREGEVVDLAEKFGIIQKGGAWYTVLEDRFQGKAKAVAHLKSHPEITEMLEDAIEGALKNEQAK